MEKRSQLVHAQSVYHMVVGLYVTALILRPILATKILMIGGLVFPGALFIFPLSFVCNDIISEVFGFEKSRAIVWVGLICQAIALFVIVLVGLLPSADFWNHQDSYEIILGQSPRIVFASLVGYYFGELVNSFVLSKMKYAQGGVSGRKQAYRFTLSTVAGELVDSLLFFAIAFIGIFSINKILLMILTTWVLKSLYEIAFLPLSTRIAQVIKEVEQTDVIDSPLTTDYRILKW